MATGFKNGNPGCCCIVATVCVNVANCDGSHASGTLVSITGPGGFSTTCTTSGAGSCCVSVPSTGTYTATVSGFGSNTVNVTGTGTFTIALCLGGTGTNFTACVVVTDCTLSVRSGVQVNFPGAIAFTDALGQACACTSPGTGTVVAPETGYADLSFTVTSRPACSVTNFGTKQLGISLTTGYVCPGCVQGGTAVSDLHTPYRPPGSLTDSRCGPATFFSTNHWGSPNVALCGNYQYTLSCLTFGLLEMDVTVPGTGLGTSATQGTWVQNPFAATFTMPVSGLYPAGATITVSYP